MLSCFIRRNFFFISRHQHKMALQNQKYEDAINALNQLQNNKMLPLNKRRNETVLVAMKQFLERVHLTDDDVNALKIVHVTGTKGKGSTCAFVESILRHNGIKTGFFSSPHLIEVRERIRINGKPISHELFAIYFWKVYNLLDSSKQNYSIKMPSYFYFLTTMALYVFKHESVEAAILEVGIGGAYDCTNVIKKPVVCGVTSLGIDHVDILGNSIESIAWQKAGIFKKSVPAFTVEQPKEGIKVMLERADEIGTTLNKVPDLSKYWEKCKIKLSLSGEFQTLNASLAVQLSYCWLGNGVLVTPLTLPQSFINGLSNCEWNGRAQILKFNNITFYLDGAHTKQSVEYAADWFNKEAAKEEDELNKSCSRVLCFNVTNDRNAYKLLSALVKCKFSGALFTPNIATLVSTGFNDQSNLRSSTDDQMLKLYSYRDDWNKLSCQGNKKFKLFTTVLSNVAHAVCLLTINREFPLFEHACSLTEHCNEFDSLFDEFSSKHLQILVTGSLHLVGGYLRVLKPDIND